MKHIIESQQFERSWLEEKLFPLADKMREIVAKGSSNDLTGKGMISLFYEPSTRTRASFEIAMRKLGGMVIFSTENARQFSSAAKGETIEDTIKVLNSYRPDVIVLRYDEEGGAKKASQISSVPIINAGDGSGQHPTQALLDLYTIKKEVGRIDEISIAMVGDLNRGRTIRSLTYLLTKFSNPKLFFVSPEALKMKDDIKNHLAEQSIYFEEGNDLRTFAPKVDVIYQTRIQKERNDITYRTEENDFYIVNQEIVNLMKKNATIMHPLPRIDEISSEVDSDPKASYFKQAENGLYIRMALLKILLG